MALFMLSSFIGLFTLPSAASGVSSYYDGSFTVTSGAETPNLHDMTLSVDVGSFVQFDARTYVLMYNAWNSATGKQKQTYLTALTEYTAGAKDFLVNAAKVYDGTRHAANVGSAFDGMLVDLRAEAASYVHSNPRDRSLSGFEPTYTVAYTFYWQRCQATPGDMYDGERSYYNLAYAQGQTSIDASLADKDTRLEHGQWLNLLNTSCFRCRIDFEVTFSDTSGSRPVESQIGSKAFSNEITVAPHTQIDASAATCTEPARQPYWICPDCGEKVAETVNGALPEETVNGVEVVRYRVLTEEDLITSPALGHEWDGGVVDPPVGCLTDGEMLYTCTRCGATERETIGATGHVYDDGVITVEPTCTERGVKTYTCTKCGDVTTVNLTALGHVWEYGGTVDPTCTEEGGAKYTCSRCNLTVMEGVKAPTGHTVDESVWVYAPDGSKRYHVCSACGEELGTETPRKLNFYYEFADGETALHAAVIHQEHGFPEFDVEEYAAIARVYANDPLEDVKAVKRAELDARKAYFVNWLSANGASESVKDSFMTFLDYVEQHYQSAAAGHCAVTLRYDTVFTMTGNQYKSLSAIAGSDGLTYADGETVDLSLTPADETLSYDLIVVVTSGLHYEFTMDSSIRSGFLFRISCNPTVLAKHAAGRAACTDAGAAAEYYTCACGRTFSFFRPDGTAYAVLCDDGRFRAKLTEVDENDYFLPALGHDLTAYPAAAATCTEAGNGAYYECTRCGKYYADAEAAAEIEKNSWVIPAAGHTPGEDWVYNDENTQRWHVCKVCGEICGVEDLEVPSVYGDLNGDGVRDIGDVTTLLDFLAIGGDSNGKFDVSGDGVVDISDVTALLDILAGARV